MKHLNRNLLCALAIRTTGSDAQKHKLLEIAIIPLTPTCDINKDVLPFNILFRPDDKTLTRAEYSIDNELTSKCMGMGIEEFEAGELFDKWFEKLGLPLGKKIMPLAHNWAAKRDFIKEWLQPTGFNLAFSEHYRDPQAIGLFINDSMDIRNELCPFPKVKLSYMAAMQKVEYTERLPTVIDECQALVNLYKSLLRSINIF
jgi:DNA polymerase III epsilon subunit-like protein